MVNIDVQIAISAWWESKKDQKANWIVVPLIPFLFQILDSLYLETRKLPLHSISGLEVSKVTTSHTFKYGLWLGAQDYSTLRCIVALLGDLSNVLETLKRKPNTLTLGPLVSKLAKLSAKDVPARNFFTHMDTVLRNFSRHGIKGPFKTSFGLEYSEGTEGNIYLMWHDNTVFFTWNHKAEELKLEKSRFDELFKIATEIYAEVINNPVSSLDKGITPAIQAYPL